MISSLQLIMEISSIWTFISDCHSPQLRNVALRPKGIRDTNIISPHVCLLLVAAKNGMQEPTLTTAIHAPRLSNLTSHYPHTA